MPELPEVQTILDTLEKNIKGETIQEIELRYPKLLEKNSPYAIEDIRGEKVIGFRRYGKYLCLELTGGYYFIIHLRMEGKFHLYDEFHEPNKHTHMLIKTENHHIHYLDTRKFSRMHITKDFDAFIKGKNLGIDPILTDVSVEKIPTKIRKSKRAIKNILLDQSIITGIGNIYADEILFACKIHPETPSDEITDSQWKDIITQTKETLQFAIKAGGTTIRSYTSNLNVNGRFQVKLQVYGKFGEPCPVCNTTLEKVTIGGRTSTFCPTCQKR